MKLTTFATVICARTTATVKTTALGPHNARKYLQIE